MAAPLSVFSSSRTRAGPTKIDGNPRHPTSLGGSNAFAQGEILRLYDPDRSEHVLHDGTESTWADAYEALDAMRTGRGRGSAVLVDGTPSPTLRAQLAALKEALPSIGIYRYDPAINEAQAEMFALLGVEISASVSYDLSQAKTILSIEADLFGLEADNVVNAAMFARTRRPNAEDHDFEMSRLYVAEPAFSITGATSDHRVQLPSSQCGDFLLAVAQAVFSTPGITAPTGAEAAVTAVEGATTGDYGDWASAIAQDLIEAGAGAVVAAGERQPAWVHGLAQLMNLAIGSAGEAVRYAQDPTDEGAGTIFELAKEIEDGDIENLLILGGNPVYNAPADLNFGELVGGVAASFRLGYYADETSEACHWHLPECHALEAWGDLRSGDGSVAIAQPLVEPLFEAVSALELVARLAGTRTTSAVSSQGTGYEVVRSVWRSLYPGFDFDTEWERWVHDGVVIDAWAGVTGGIPAFVWSGLGTAIGGYERAEAPSADHLEVVFAKDYSVYDGRYSNVSWLQELPDPITKITWDNAPADRSGHGR